MEQITNIKEYIEFGITIIVAITALILLLKMLFKKLDKNNNGKIEKEEITEADIEFCKELLKESIKTIALGMHKQGGMNSEQINTIMIKEIKNSKNLIEETIKKEKEKKNNEKN